MCGKRWSSMVRTIFASMRARRRMRDVTVTAESLSRGRAEDS